MTILDRYVFFNFVKQLVLWYVTLVGLFVVLDAFQNLDGFFALDGERSALVVLGIHYFFVSFSVIDMLLPLLIVLSALGSVATMLRRNEIIALQAMGISKIRLVVPIVVAAVLVCLLSCWTREVFIPRHILNVVSTIQELANPGKGVKVKPVSDHYTRIILNGTTIDPKDNRIVNPVVSFPAKFFGIDLTDIKAETAVFCPEDKSQKRPRGYHFQHVSVGAPLLAKGSLVLKEIVKPVVLAPVDYPDWLKPDECFVVTGIEPELLMVGQQWYSLTSTARLLGELGNPSCDYSRTKMAVTIHSRILRPLADLVPILIALPFILLRCDRSVVQAMAVGGGLALLYIGVQFVCMYLGPTFGFSILAAWFPLLLFAPLVTCVFWELRH